MTSTRFLLEIHGEAMSHHDLLGKRVQFFDRDLKHPSWQQCQITATRDTEVNISPVFGRPRWIPITDLKPHEYQESKDS